MIPCATKRRRIDMDVKWDQNMDDKIMQDSPTYTVVPPYENIPVRTKIEINFIESMSLDRVSNMISNIHRAQIYSDDTNFVPQFMADQSGYDCYNELAMEARLPLWWVDAAGIESCYLPRVGLDIELVLDDKNIDLWITTLRDSGPENKNEIMCIYNSSSMKNPIKTTPIIHTQIIELSNVEWLAKVDLNERGFPMPSVMGFVMFKHN